MEMMLNKNNFEIAKLASKDEDDAVAMKGILVAPDKTVVTNGRLVLEMTGFEHAEDILPFDGLKSQSNFGTEFVRAENALMIAKTFVKSDSPDANLIGIDPSKLDSSRFGLRQPNGTVVFSIDKVTVEYPEYESLFPKIDDELFAVTLNADLLIPLLQQLAKLDYSVRFGFYGPEKMIRLDCINNLTKQSARAGIMPMKV